MVTSSARLRANPNDVQRAEIDDDEILRHRRGRPPIGSGPASVESVRLDPELRRALAERAERDRGSTSEVISNYLKTS